MLLQAATETIKSSSSIYFDGVAVMALIGAGGLIVREFIMSYRNKKNGNGQKPGLSLECRRHEVELARMDIEQKNTKEDIIEIKTDIKDMKVDIKELLRRTPPR